MLQRALAFASAVVEIRGATTFDRTLYSATLSEWEQQADPKKMEGVDA